MYKILIILALVMSSSINFQKVGAKVVGTPTPKSNAYNILIIGFEDTRLRSNFFLIDEIAEKTMTNIDSLGYHFNITYIKNLKNNGNNDINLMSLTDVNHLHQFYNHVKYIGSGERITARISTNNTLTLNNLLNEYNPDYILFLNSYEIRWQGNPFNTVFHILNFDIFSRSFEHVYNGVTSFSQSELTPLTNVQSKINRSTNRIMAQVVKNIR